MSAPAPSASLSAASTSAAAAAASSKRSLPSADERRVQPRHDRDEPESKAADAAAEPASMPSRSSGISAGAAVQSTSSPPAAMLYRHALECILAFSDAKTLAAALRVSKEWLAAVGSMGRLALTVRCSNAPVESATVPAMARHVADLDTFYAGERMSAEAVGSLARHMPHLRRLKCWAPLLPEDGPLVFPDGLRELELFARERSVSISQVNAAIAGAGRLERLQSLELDVKRSWTR